MKTYKELLKEVRTTNPEMTFMDAQKEASRLNKAQKEVEPQKEADKSPFPEQELSPGGVVRSSILEREIRSKKVSLKRILKIISGSGLSSLNVYQKGDHIIVSGPDIRVPIKGSFLISLFS